MSKKRKWDDDYVRFGFTCFGKTKCLQKFLSMLCETVFSNANLKPSKLQELFENRHGGADFLGHAEQSLRAKRARFDFLTILQ